MRVVVEEGRGPRDGVWLDALLYIFVVLHCIALVVLMVWCSSISLQRDESVVKR